MSGFIFSRSSRLFFTAFLFILLIGCDEVLSPPSRSVCISGYNQYERHIHQFWLDNEGKAGCHGNPSGRKEGSVYGGGGGFVCGCRVTPGKEVNLYWGFEQTLAEYRAKQPQEKHTIRVKIPPLGDSANPEYLRIYFFKNGTAQLQWDEDFGTPKLVPPSEGKINE